MNFSEQYWNERYNSKQTGWDIGSVSTPLKEYFDQLNDKNIRILVPGAGMAWEVEYLFRSGFSNTFILDFSEKAIAEFKNRCPWFPDDQIINQDFFKHNDTYDLIVEQTFFSSLDPVNRPNYVKHVFDLLKEGGKIMGLLFNYEFDFIGPPFGGTKEEYKQLFSPFFEFEIFEIAVNSIEPRKGRELFLLLQKR